MIDGGSSQAAHRTSRAARPRAAPPGRLLASHDHSSLAALLRAAGGTPTAARRAAGAVLGRVFRQRLEEPLSDEALAEIGVGAWARPPLRELDPSPSLKVVGEAEDADGVARLLLEARDGAWVETVIIPGPTRTTVCISSQVGCARACAFCETGALGFSRQLDAGEIVDQVRLAQRRISDPGRPLSNVVFMGMGEPFDNLAEVARATRLLTDPRAFGLAPSRITVSTVGVADKLEVFFREARAELAVSLNAPSDPLRSEIMPINARFPLARLRRALDEHLPPGRRVFFEYVLFDRWNDEPEHADALARFAAGLRCRINVIPANPGPDPRFAAPAPERVDAFVARLSGHGLTVLVRRPRGRAVGGACGQLAGARRLPVASSGRG